MEKDVVLHFDGACWPNPGGLATCGWTLSVAGPREQDAGGEGPVLASESRVAAEGPGATNNVAEWSGLGFALRWLRDDGWRGGRLTIRGDSRLVIHQLTGEWRSHDPRLARLKARCLELLRELDCDWDAEWVPRARNSRADGLSLRAWEEAKGKPFPQLR